MSSEMSSEEWTPERYLHELEAFLESNASELYSGKRTLQLHPRGLEFVNSKLETLDRLNDLDRSAQPLDYIRAYVSDINDHQRLERIQSIILRLCKVKLMSLSRNQRDPTPIDLSRFRFLTSLEVYKCDLSTHPVLGLVELRSRLENLIVSNSAEALGHIFAPRADSSSSCSKSIQGAGDLAVEDIPREWQKLTSVKCTHNSCSRMDSSLTLLTCVRNLDLSSNCFKVMENLHNCVNLMTLDLSHNRIASTPRLNERCGNLTQLKLKCNSLTSTDGIDKLYSLEVLDLSGNLISKFKEVARLGSLPCLELLWLKENPIYYASKYRTQVLCLFPDPEGFKLDNQKTSQKELQTVERLKREEQLHKATVEIGRAQLEDTTSSKSEQRATRPKAKSRIIDLEASSSSAKKPENSNSSNNKSSSGTKQSDSIKGSDSSRKSSTSEIKKASAGILKSLIPDKFRKKHVEKEPLDTRPSWMWSTKEGPKVTSTPQQAAAVDVVKVKENDAETTTTSRGSGSMQQMNPTSPPRFNELVIEKLKDAWYENRTRPSLLLQEEASASSSSSSSFGVYSESDEEEGLKLQSQKFYEWELLQQSSEEKAKELLLETGESPERYETHYSCFAVVPKRNWSIDFCCLLVVTSANIYIYQIIKGKKELDRKDLVFKVEKCDSSIKVGISMQTIRIASQSLNQDSIVFVTGKSSVTSEILSYCSSCEICTWELEERKGFTKGYLDLRAYCVLTVRMAEDKVSPCAVAIVDDKLIVYQVKFMRFGEVDYYGDTLAEIFIQDVSSVSSKRYEDQLSGLKITWSDTCTSTDARSEHGGNQNHSDGAGEECSSMRSLVFHNYKGDFCEKIMPLLESSLSP
jgi:hypothetical protein